MIQLILPLVLFNRCSDRESQSWLQSGDIVGIQARGLGLLGYDSVFPADSARSYGTPRFRALAMHDAATQ
jgi:hypothetical protein